MSLISGPGVAVTGAETMGALNIASVGSREVKVGLAVTGGLKGVMAGTLFGGGGDLRERFRGGGRSGLDGGRGAEYSWDITTPAFSPDGMLALASLGGVCCKLRKVTGSLTAEGVSCGRAPMYGSAGRCAGRVPDRET
jgi:hypothetical protein